MIRKIEKPIVQGFFKGLELGGPSRFWPDGIDALND